MISDSENGSEDLTVDQRIERAVGAFQRHEYSEALEDLEKVLEEKPRFPDIWNKTGLCLAMLGNLEEALQRLDHAIELAPEYAEAHLNRAIVLNSLGRFSEAEKAFASASSLDTQDEGSIPSEVGNQIANLHAKLGDLYKVAERTWEAAREYRTALEVRPRFFDIRTKYAEALIDLEELEEAHEELRYIVEERPEFPDGHLRLGVVLRRLGRHEEAAEQWKKCLELRPGDRRAQAYLAAHRERD